MDDDELLNRLTAIRDELRAGTFLGRPAAPVVLAGHDRRRAAIKALIMGGATAGERAAAEAALARVDAETAEHAATMDRLDVEADSFLGGYE